MLLLGSVLVILKFFEAISIPWIVALLPYLMMGTMQMVYEFLDYAKDS